jgi:ATP-dependent helicase/DNAse subunit B
MPLTLITGPANAGKAELVFEALRAEAARGGAPWLVLPTAADARHYRQELAHGGAVLGVRVARFRDLGEEIARRAKVTGVAIDRAAREQILAALLAAADSRAAEPGYARELGSFVGELERLHVSPKRLRRALAAWERSDCAVSGHALPAGALYERYRELLRTAGCLDAELRTAKALDALRESPSLWHDRFSAGARARAVLFYGFDDLTALELDAVETLARVVDAPVTVALAYESGRVAFAERAAAVQALLPFAAEHVVVPPTGRHYAAAARTALAHLERRLFEPSNSPADGSGRAAGAAITLLEGGGERAELELVAAEIRALLERGVPAREIALVHRSPAMVEDTLREVLPAHGVPFAAGESTRFAHSPLGRGLVSLLRCALLDGDSADLLRWLRTPGVVERVELVDGFELRLRRAGTRAAEDARRLWEDEHWPLSVIDHLRAAAARGPVALVDRVERELRWLFCSPRAGVARELAEHERPDASAFRAATAALAQMRALVAKAPPIGEPSGLVAMLEELGVEREPSADVDAVPLLDPLQLRARRVRALFLCGLQERVFPAPAKAPPFLGDQERRSLAEGSGLLLERQPDWLARERYLFYACVSRPEELLALSWHTADDEGNASARSLFVDDVCDLFDERLLDERRRRSLGAVDAPRKAAFDGRYDVGYGAIGQLRDERLLDELREQRLWSASSLRAFACCPVRWFVEHLLRPESLEPDSEPLAVGRVIHGALTDVLEALKRASGSARLTPAQLEHARTLVTEALARRCAQTPLSVAPAQHAGLRLRLEADLERFLEHAASEDGSLEPSHFELPFGLGDRPSAGGERPEADLPALDLGDGVRVRGRIDRVDVGRDGRAVVYDYKRRGGHTAPPGEKWRTPGSFQVALYMRAVRELLGLDVVGGFYQPVTGEDLRARGALEHETEAPAMRSDRYERAELDALVDDAVALARSAAAQARAGEIEPHPRTCAVSGQGCMYPTICRCER